MFHRTSDYLRSVAMAWDPAATISNYYCLVPVPYDMFSPVTPVTPPPPKYYIHCMQVGFELLCCCNFKLFFFCFKAYVVKMPLLLEYSKKFHMFYMYRPCGDSSVGPASVQCSVAFKYRTLLFLRLPNFLSC